MTRQQITRKQLKSPLNRAFLVLYTSGLFCFVIGLVRYYLYLSCTLNALRYKFLLSALFFGAYWHLISLIDTYRHLMSSNIEVQRICQQCGKEFTARTTVTQYCGDTCAKRAYKARLKAAKVETSNKETRLIKSKPFEELKAKEFLTVRDVATLLNSSIRTVYRLIEQGNIKAANIAQRKTLVKRSELDKLFL